ncbi:phage tail protein [Metapseudomonas otitidis]|uniref:phage tail protein n=1 Tax=Metapseudomonas otitidis TaxID=319939 RepID=UPI002097F29F|nr:tail fiber protein [Pseudomonas otitidis]MCO7556193.1 tail fiber protein [Pseudomonas otitidis]
MTMSSGILQLAVAIGADIKQLLAGMPNVGEIRGFAGATAPAGWLLCQGQVLSTTEHPELFAVIGNAYGGDGVDTFALPDATGRVMRGAGSGNALGSSGGADSVTLSANQMPAHTHRLEGDGAGLRVSTLTPGAAAPIDGGCIGAAAGGSAAAANIWHAAADLSAATLQTGLSGNTTSAGSGEAVDIRPAFVAVNFIIYAGN